MFNNFITNASEIKAYIEPYMLDIIISIAIGVFTIIVAIGEDVKDKYYQKKYLLTCYVLLWILSIFLGISTPWIFFTFLVLILSLSVLNLSYSNNKNNYLEQELTAVKYWLYHTFYWIFIVKMYIFFLCLVITSLIPNLHIKFGIILLFSIFHLYENSKDLLGVQPFTVTRDRIVKQMNEFNEYFNAKNSTEKENIYNLLGFIIYTEDRNYFNRNGANTNLKTLFVKKYGVPFNLINLVKKIKDILKENIYIQNENREKKRKFKTYIEIFKSIFRRYFRGYSTIEMQHIRINVMNPNSYDYVIRRKIFVEGIYTYFYFYSWKKFILRMKGKNYNQESINTYIKLVILKSYFMDKDILKTPVSYNDLIEKFTSRLGARDYENLYADYDRVKEDYKKEILENLKIADRVYNMNE